MDARNEVRQLLEDSEWMIDISWSLLDIKEFILMNVPGCPDEVINEVLDDAEKAGYSW